MFWSVLGFMVCIGLLAFAIWGILNKNVNGGTATGLIFMALLAPTMLRPSSAGWRAKFLGNEFEKSAERAEDAASKAEADRQAVEALKADVQMLAGNVQTTADNLKGLETRYRGMIGDTGQLTYLMWRVRGQFGRLPGGVEGTLGNLVQNLLDEAYPDPTERQAVIDRIERISPPTGAGIMMR